MESDSDYEEASEDLKYVGDVVPVVAQPILEYFAPSVLTHKL